MSSTLTAEAAAQLLDGINLVLSRWAALRMAVENEWGGPDSAQKPQELGQKLFQRLTQSREQVYMDDLEDMLDEFMLSLNTEIGDGSIGEIAEKLMFMHEECLEGNFDSINKLRETNAPSVSYVRLPGSNDDEDSEEENGDIQFIEDNSSAMDIDAPQQPNLDVNDATHEAGPREAPEVVDGWTVVSSRRNRGRRN